MKKRLLSVFLCLCMMLTMVPAALAVDDQDSPDTQTTQTEENTQEASGSLPEADENGLIKLENDVTLAKTYEVPTGSSAVLDLNGHTITINADVVGITVKGENTKLTIQDSGDNGTITRGSSCSSAYTSGILEVNDGGTIEMNAGTIDAVYDEEDKSNNTGWYGVTVFNDSTFVMNGGKINAGWAAAATNGTNTTTSSTYGNNAKIIINDGTLTSSSDYAIYAPAQDGVTTINGGTIMGYWGAIQLKRGTLDISGGTFENNGVSSVTKPDDQHDGTTPDHAAAISLTSDYGAISATIRGGTFTTQNGNDVIKVTEKSSNKVDVSIIGGTFSNDISQYLKTGYVCTKNGAYYVVAPLGVENAAAESGGVYYETLSKAIEGAGNAQTITLLKNVQENVTIPEGKSLCLDLNGKTLTETTAMVVQGTLTIQDRTAVSDPVVGNDYEDVSYTSGVIVNTGNGDGIVVKSGGSLNLESGKVKATGNCGIYVLGNQAPESSAETDKEPYNSQLVMTGGYIEAPEFGAAAAGRGAKLSIQDGVIVAHNNAAVAGNGTNSSERYDGGTTIEISGGTIISHITSPGYIACGVYHPQKGSLTISGGTIYADGGVGVLMRGGTLEMTNGTVIATGTASGKVGDSREVQNCYGVQLDGKSSYYDHANTKIEISGGAISSDATVENVNKIDAEENSVTSGYIADGCAALPSTEEGYAFMVGEMQGPVVEDVEPAAGVPVVDVSEIAAKDQEKAKEVAQSVQDNGVLAAAANSVLNEVTAAQVEAAKEALKKSDVSVGEQDINTYVQTYLNVTPTAYNESSFTLDIQPMYRVVASTAESASEIKVIDEVTEGANAVALEGSEKPLDIQTMTVSITLPDDFVTNGTQNVYVQHKGYEYEAQVKAAGEQPSTTYIATFTNPHGFSAFTVTKESAAVAEVNGNRYTSFQDAVDAAGDKATVEVLKNENLTATMSGSSRTITVKNGAGESITVTINGTTKTIEENASVDFTYTHSSSSGTTRYSVEVRGTTGGTVTASPTRAAKGATVTLTVRADEGYQLDGLTVTDSKGGTVKLTDKGSGTYTFTMPASKVTVQATFTQNQSGTLPFTDVKTGDWFYEAVQYVYDKGMMTGVSADRFAPASTTTRGMIVTILYRLENEPAVSGDLAFTDVESGAWYADAVAWAAANDIVNGTSATTFAPNSPITREQMATMLYRFAQYKGMDAVTLQENLTGYPDGDQVSDYAIPAMNWAVGQGLIAGMENGTLVPQGSATRAQVATILMRFCENVMQ